MRIVVNHLTRMVTPRICIAGIDPASSAHVRPVTPGGDRITRRLLRESRGPLAIGAEVELGEVEPDGSAPETEDHRFSTRALEHVRDLEGDEFLSLLDRIKSRDLQEAFGPALERHGWTYAIRPSTGCCSLAILRAGARPRLEVDRRYGKLRLRFSDPKPTAYLPVTDVRFYEPDHKTLRTDAIRDVRRRLARGVGAMLMLGVTRPWQASQDTQERHWLQLNGLVLDDRPTGERP
jgi:hypothetical protein